MDINKKLLTKFRVHKVHFEPHSESIWYLEYNGVGPIKCYELSETIESDEKLSNKEIEAQIDLDSCEVLPTNKKEKSMNFQGSYITTTGTYDDDDYYTINGNTYKEYIINSIFPLRISLGSMSIPVKKGEWITLCGSASLILPRGINLKDFS